MITAAEMLAVYRRQLTDTCAVTRGTTTVAAVPCRIVGYQPQELVSGIVAGDRKAILLSDPIADGGIALPLRKGDRLTWSDGGSTLSLAVVATSAPRKVGAVAVAIEVQVRGA